MKLINTFIFILFGMLNINVYAQPIFNDINKENKKLFDIRISSNINNCSMRLDKDETKILNDTLLYTDISSEDEPDTTEYILPYTTDFGQQKYNIHIGYIGLENFYVYAKFPFVHTNVIEKFSKNENMTQRRIKNNKSDTYLEGVNLDAGYNFAFEKTDISLISELFIPFGEWNIPADLDTSQPTNNKWLDLNRKYEFNVGTQIDIKLQTIHFNIGCAYNHRGGNFTDRLLTKFLVGLNNIEDTELFAMLKYNMSLGDYKEEYAISFWKYPYWSKTLEFELGFKMFFTDEFYINVGYDVLLLGKNTLATRIININFGYLF